MTQQPIPMNGSGYIGSDRPYLDGPHEAELQVVAIFPYKSGEGHCHHFHDSEGRLVVWFTKRKKSLKVGDRVRASFIVESHTEYLGVKQNLTRQFRLLDLGK